MNLGSSHPVQAWVAAPLLLSQTRWERQQLAPAAAQVQPRCQLPQPCSAAVCSSAAGASAPSSATNELLCLHHSTPLLLHAVPLTACRPGCRRELLLVPSTAWAVLGCLLAADHTGWEVPLAPSSSLKHCSSLKTSGHEACSSSSLLAAPHHQLGFSHCALHHMSATVAAALSLVAADGSPTTGRRSSPTPTTVGAAPAAVAGSAYTTCSSAGAVPCCCASAEGAAGSCQQAAASLAPGRSRGSHQRVPVLRAARRQRHQTHPSKAQRQPQRRRPRQL